jgi:hypothetical protein
MLSLIKKIGNCIYSIAEAIHEAKKSNGYVSYY